VSHDSVRLGIAGVTLELRAPSVVLAATRMRYAGFVTQWEPAAVLEIRHAPPEFSALIDRGDGVDVVPNDDGWQLSGRLCGAVDSDGGWLASAPDLGAVDALVRLALVRMLPAQGALPFHAALTDDGTVFAGRSGAGKSTVAAALGGPCDELSVVGAGIGGNAVSAWSTPYWGQRPVCVPLRRVVILDAADGDAAGIELLSAVDALRALSAQVVRWAPLPSVDRPTFALLGELCASVEVVRARCPRGERFLPFIAEALS